MVRDLATQMEDANAMWGANCGPGAVAAIMGMSLEAVHPHFDAVDFGNKRYTSPGMMWDVLRSIGRPWRTHTGKLPHLPRYGLARVQWEGPWTEPGANPRWAYRQTHWIGARTNGPLGHLDDVGIFDVNALANGTGWCSLHDWASTIVPFILQSYPRASGVWHVTHSVEIGGGDG